VPESFTSYYSVVCIEISSETGCSDIATRMKCTRKLTEELDALRVANVRWK
jgi:hypothetical protein